MYPISCSRNLWIYSAKQIRLHSQSQPNCQLSRGLLKWLYMWSMHYSHRRGWSQKPGESTLIWRTKKSSLLPELSDQQTFIHAIKCLLNTFGMFFTTNVFKIPTSAPELCSGTGHLSSVVGWLRHFSGCLTWRSFRGWQSSNTDFIRIKSTKACIPYLSALCSFHQRLLRPHSFCVWRLGKAALQEEACQLSPQTHPSNRREGGKRNNGHFHYNLIRLWVWIIWALGSCPPPHSSLVHFFAC